MNSFNNIALSRHDAVGVITITRPASRNALNGATFLELEEALTVFEEDAAIGAVVVTGEGERAFIAGADIDEMSGLSGLQYHEGFGRVAQRVMRRFEACPKPTIAAINGWALGGGAELVLSLDIRYIADTAKIGFPEIGLGIFPGAGGTQRLTRQIPLCRAKELLFSGDAIDAQAAYQMGLVNKVTTPAMLREEALAYGQRLAARPRVAMSLLKMAVAKGLEMTLDSGLHYELALAGLSFSTHDAHEGLVAFTEKRPARFTNT